MTRQTTPENTPGHAVYVGMQGNLHGTPAVRVYHVTSGPNLPPPIPYERLLSAAPDLLAALEEIMRRYDELSTGRTRAHIQFQREIESARAAIRKATGQEG